MKPMRPCSASCHIALSQSDEEGQRRNRFDLTIRIPGAQTTAQLSDCRAKLRNLGADMS